MQEITRMGDKASGRTAVGAVPDLESHVKKLLLTAVLAASFGLPATAASASCTPTPIEGGPSCMEQAACRAASTIDKVLPADCIQ